jgi:hypothetical protein
MCRKIRSSRGRGDFVERLGLSFLYKTASGVKVHSESTCQYLEHLTMEEKSKMATKWCSDCKRKVNARGVTMLADGV